MHRFLTSIYGPILRVAFCGWVMAALGAVPMTAEVVEWVTAPPHLRFTPLTVDGESTVLGVRAFHQDREGFLWLGGGRGLRRYDGYSLHDAADGKGEHRVAGLVTMAVDGDGRLWVATAEGDVLGYDDTTETWAPHPAMGAAMPTAGSSSRQVTSFLWDASGLFWIGTSDGLDMWSPGAGVRRHGVPAMASEETPSPTDEPADDAECGLRDPFITALLEDSQGTLWVGSRGGLFRYDRVRSCFQPFVHDPSDPRSLSSNHVTALLEDRQGTLWVGTADGGLDRMVGGDGKFFHLRAAADNTLALPDDHVTALYEDSLEHLWVGTPRGLSRLQTSTGRFDNYGEGRFGLPPGAVETIYEDRAGTLWVGAQGGVSRLPSLRRYFHHYLEVGPDPAAELQHASAIYEDLNHRLWVGTASRGLFVVDRRRRSTHHFYESPKRRVAAPAAMTSAAITSIVGNGQGEIWVATAGAGIWWRHPESRLAQRDVLKPLPAAGGLPEIADAVVSDLALDGERLWIATADRGLYRYHKATDGFDSWRRAADGTDGLASDRLTALLVSGSAGVDESTAGRGVWLGTRDAGLDRLRFEADGGTTFEHLGADWGRRFGPHTLAVNDLYEDAWGNLWVATEGGLVHLTEDGTVVDLDRRLDHRPIRGLVADRDDRLWISGDGGLWRLPIAAPDDEGSVVGSARGIPERVEHFTVEHGLPGGRFSAGAAFHGRGDEELFFAGDEGITAFSPQLLVLERPAPSVVLTEVMVEGQIRRLPRDAWDVALDSEERALEVEVAALDFVDPQRNRYAFFLEGEDRGWVETGHQRRIRYNYLKPGDYTLYVAAAHADGVWNREALRLDVRVQPKLRQRTTFQIGVALLAAFGITLLVLIWDRGRHRRQVRLRELEIEGKQRQLGAQEDERSKLAGEIHGGPLTALPALATQLEEQSKVDPAVLQQVAGRLRETSSELREISSRLHSPVLGRFGLAAAIHEHLGRLRREHPRLEIQTELTDDGQRLSEATRLAFYRIYEQAVDNAVRHGDPSWIRLVLELSNRGCCLRVIDDGRGFRVPMKWVQLLRGKHPGLLDMVERAESISGRCYVRSARRRGTEVRVVAPLQPRMRRLGR